MLISLAIRDVVIIDRLDLDFARGLSALTGETGAGKSILLDALGLALGARGEARMVRPGAAQLSVAAQFAPPPGHEALAIAAGQDLAIDAADGLVLRRVISADGRSRAFVNDQPVSVGLLRRLGEVLVEVHGQFENQRLLDPSSHRLLLDAFGGLQPLAFGCAEAWAAWRAARAALQQAEAELAAARRDEDYLRHAVAEIESVATRPAEEAELAQRRALLMNAEKLAQALQEAGRELAPAGSGRGVGDGLRSALRGLQRVAGKAEGRFDAILAALERAADAVEEAAALLDRASRDADLDPLQLEQVEERLFRLRALARKHDVAVDDLPRLAEALAQRLSGIDSGEGRLKALAAAEGAAAARYRQAADDLTAARRAAAARLDAEVAGELAPLHLARARFATVIDPQGEADWGAHGWDKVAFQVATNPGLPPGPLARIASGGELARFTLALKVVLAAADPVPTLIFDEVDAGVGGAVAEAVGERLARLAGDVQVLVVTHSPQVAARGHHHWRISKEVAGDTARTVVDVLDPEGRRNEIARMLAGARITEEARAAAASLLLGAAGR
jgi:DNA repair protein RecN (Recombination protein N)